MGSDEKEKVAQLQFSKTRKRPSRKARNEISSAGAETLPASTVSCGRAYSNPHDTKLGRGRCPYDPEYEKQKKGKRENER